MKAVFLFVLGVFAVQSTFAQVIRTAPIVATAPIIQSNSVATTLADTLSLLTVSSLLSEKLPFDYPCGCAPCLTMAPKCAPYEIIAPIAPVVGNCGCGCNGYGYPYNTYPYVL